MKIKSWLEQAKTKIDALDAELIALDCFSICADTDRSWLVAHSEDKIKDDDLEKANLRLKERQEGKPLAYVIARKEFYGRDFMVGPAVLIPRPETETMIDVIKTLPLPTSPKFLEIGTGSGCIAVTLALEYPQAQVLATDISGPALVLAGYNDSVYEGRVELMKSDLLSGIKFDEPREHFNVVVANLPYVNKKWDWVDQESLKYEPAHALYAKGNNGLSIYQRFLKELNHYQRTQKIWIDYVALEADPCQHVALIRMAEKVGLRHLRTEGFCVLFEDSWRYWLDSRTREYVHKPEAVIQEELATGIIHDLPEEFNY